jgi:S-adenosylmethionine:tRNA ribosyltransferase-isomerase
VKTEEFDYLLPSDLIAQQPAHPRDACRLLVLDRASGGVQHRMFADLVEYLAEGDVLVVNETRVLPARLRGRKEETGSEVEVLLLRERYSDTWECLAKPGRRLKPGSHIVFGDGILTGFVVDVVDDTGGRLIRFRAHGTTLLDAVHAIGEIPLPPYVTGSLEDPEDYQTIFARDERSAAAPTAGLHFTAELLDRVRAAGVGVVPVELDIGLDTFRPVSEEDPRSHKIHSEHFSVSERTAVAVNAARDRGGRVVAVGTTSVRALESAYDDESGRLMPTESSTSLYILPGYDFRVVQGLVTNFHIPRSTLLMLVSAFAGRELVMSAYRTALEERYRFLSLGDAMLVL